MDAIIGSNPEGNVPALAGPPHIVIYRRVATGRIVKAGIVIPPDFSTRLANGNASVLILLDGSDSFSVQSGYSAASLVSQNYALRISAQQTDRTGGKALILAQATSAPITNSFRVLYNPDFRDLWFVLPAIIGMLLQTAAVSQAALVVVRERESGTIEQILATPTRPLELLIGKMVPLLVLCFLIIGIILALGVFWFGVTFRGNLLLYLWLTLFFISSSLGLGFLISTVSKNQRQAQQFSSVLMLFSMLLTGVVYPRNVMPLIPKLIGSLLPLTYFIRISRGIIMKGVGVTLLWPDVVALVVYSLAVMIVAALNFKKREELTKHFGEFVAVDHVNFSVAEGEIFGWLGPNGAGKTTTIRMLLGLMKPTSGRMSVLDDRHCNAKRPITENYCNRSLCIAVS